MVTDKLKNEDVAKSADGVTLELAPIEKRFFALVIDSILLGILSVILGGLLGGAQGVGFYFLLNAAYQWYFLTRRDGQTFGKQKLGIRVVRTDGRHLSGADAILRVIGYSINNVVPPLWFWALIDSNRQGLQDKLAKTYVVMA